MGWIWYCTFLCVTRSSEFVWTFHIEKVDGTKEDVKSQTVQQPNRNPEQRLYIVYALESLFQERLFCGTTQVSGKRKESHRFSKTGQLLGGAPPPCHFGILQLSTASERKNRKRRKPGVFVDCILQLGIHWVMSDSVANSGIVDISWAGDRVDWEFGWNWDGSSLLRANTHETVAHRARRHPWSTPHQTPSCSISRTIPSHSHHCPGHRTERMVDHHWAHGCRMRMHWIDWSLVALGLAHAETMAWFPTDQCMVSRGRISRAERSCVKLVVIMYNDMSVGDGWVIWEHNMTTWRNSNWYNSYK